MRRILKFIKSLFPEKVATEKKGKAWCPRYKMDCFGLDLRRDGKCAYSEDCKSHERRLIMLEKHGLIKRDTYERR